MANVLLGGGRLTIWRGVSHVRGSRHLYVYGCVRLHVLNVSNVSVPEDTVLATLLATKGRTEGLVHGGGGGTLITLLHTFVLVGL